ncbi:unnamed protein product [Phaedon cochleariae]|uniref:Cytochrome P450 n=1 Tax=Phaedon cochleariae TaxID=80249 RepID=A0A9N9SJH1_PHACE|nr:unnamed protein product [Phaedon cochleariae]
MLTEIAILFASVGIVAVLFVKYKYGYWKRRNVPYLEPTFPTGNNTSFFPKGIAIGKISDYFYKEFKARGVKRGGVYLGVDPSLVLLDPEDVRTVLVKEFNSFVDRGIYGTKADPTTVHLVTQNGQEWKSARVKYTSVFTSAKMKIMYDAMKKTITYMLPLLEDSAKRNLDVDVLDTTARFTTDSVGSTIFGVECNSFKDPDAEFRNLGIHLLEQFSPIDRMRLFMVIYFPKLAAKLNISNIQTEVSTKFTRLIKDTVEYREKNNVSRKDFLDMLIQLKNSGQHITLDELIGQTFVFFLAGFETSSSTTTMTLYELAENQDVQDRLREEITSTFEKNNNDLSYEALMGMKYLGQVIDETLRMWPPVISLLRVCVKDFKFPDSDLLIEKGTRIIIPALSLHRDPDHFPDPLKFSPDRFEDKNKKYPAYLPFGDGPRNCIGLRYGLMQVRVGLATILRDYKVLPSPSTKRPLEIDPDTFLLRTTERVCLKFEKIN